MYYIYKITNTITNKAYIGFTHDPKERWSNHRTDYKRINRPLYNSMKKHGRDVFTFEIIYEHEDRRHTLVEMEPYYIELYDSYNNGYNCNRGGLDTNTDEMRRNTSNRMKTNNPMKILRTNKGSFKKGESRGPDSEITREKKRVTKLGTNNPNFGNPNAGAHLKIKRACSKCGTITTPGNLKRWHEENCQHRKL
jgi:group I intron endonuclease